MVYLKSFTLGIVRRFYSWFFFVEEEHEEQCGQSEQQEHATPFFLFLRFLITVPTITPATIKTATTMVMISIGFIKITYKLSLLRFAFIIAV